MTYQERIKGLREDNDFTQETIAKILHISQNTYSQYENGVRQMPIDIIIQLSEIYEVTTDYILKGV